jgi:hypothetical protein
MDYIDRLGFELLFFLSRNSDTQENVYTVLFCSAKHRMINQTI